MIKFLIPMLMLFFGFYFLIGSWRKWTKRKMLSGVKTLVLAVISAVITIFLVISFVILF